MDADRARAVRRPRSPCNPSSRRLFPLPVAQGNDGLEELSTTALKRLVSLQQLGVERAQTALKSLTEASRA